MTKFEKYRQHLIDQATENKELTIRNKLIGCSMEDLVYLAYDGDLEVIDDTLNELDLIWEALNHRIENL